MGGQETWSIHDLRRLDREDTLAHNWKAQWEYANLHRDYLDLCKSIVSTRGLVLEVGAGPGGGNFSPIKHLCPEIPVILNDIEPRILSRWSRYMRDMHPQLPVTYAAFDVCNMPLADGDVSCVSSAGGLSNIMGPHGDALAECARVLKPGGIVACFEMVLTERCRDSLPGEFVSAMIYHPWLFGEWHSLFDVAALTVLSDIAVEQRFLSPVDSALALDAASYGATLEVEYRCVLARKS